MRGLQVLPEVAIRIRIRAGRGSEDLESVATGLPQALDLGSNAHPTVELVKPNHPVYVVVSDGLQACSCRPHPGHDDGIREHRRSERRKALGQRVDPDCIQLRDTRNVGRWRLAPRRQPEGSDQNYVAKGERKHENDPEAVPVAYTVPVLQGCAFCPTVCSFPPSVRLVADALSMRYGHRRLFEDLSFTVEPGVPLAILGANGSGKSTLLRILSGVLEPVAGEARLETVGSTRSGADLTPQVGFVAPALQLYEAFSARENLDFLARARRLRRRSDAIGSVLDRVGLAPRADERVATYSTGMRQRLRLAAALLHAPPVLLLDEPGATLDAPGRNLVADLFDAEDRILVVATNDPVEAKRCPRRVTLMEVAISNG